MLPTLNCILLIDDDKLTNFMNKIIIDEVSTVEHFVRKESAKSALEYISSSATSDSSIPFPDLIFLDISMPNTDGWGFLDSFQKVKPRPVPQPVIVMLSQFVNSDCVLKAADFPFLSGIYKKPLAVEVYASIVNKYFVAPAVT